MPQTWQDILHAAEREETIATNLARLVLGYAEKASTARSEMSRRLLERGGRLSLVMLEKQTNANRLLNLACEVEHRAHNFELPYSAEDIIA